MVVSMKQEVQGGGPFCHRPVWEVGHRGGWMVHPYSSPLPWDSPCGRWAVGCQEELETGKGRTDIQLVSSDPCLYVSSRPGPGPWQVDKFPGDSSGIPRCTREALWLWLLDGASHFHVAACGNSRLQCELFSVVKYFDSHSWIV